MKAEAMERSRGAIFTGTGGSKKGFGREYRDTLIYVENIAWKYRKQVLREQAKKLFLQAWKWSLALATAALT